MEVSLYGGHYMYAALPCQNSLLEKKLGEKQVLHVDKLFAMKLDKSVKRGWDKTCYIHIHTFEITLKWKKKYLN